MCDAKRKDFSDKMVHPAASSRGSGTLGKAGSNVCPGTNDQGRRRAQCAERPSVKVKKGMYSGIY